MNKRILVIILFLEMCVFCGSANSFAIEKKGYRGCDNDSPNWLLHDWSLYHGACLVSPNGVYVAIFQTDGNFVTYRFHGTKAVEKGLTVAFDTSELDDRDRRKVIWASGTHKKGHEGQRLILQNDGNMVMYDRQGWENHRSVWSSGTQHSGAELLILNNVGELVLYDGKGLGSEFGPKITGWEEHRQFRSGGKHFVWVGGNWAKNTPSGVFISEIFLDKAENRFNKNTPSQSSARLSIINCSKDGTHSTGSQALTATVEESQTWGTSSTRGFSSTIGVELGGEAFTKLKLEFTVSQSIEVNHSQTSSNSKAFNLTAYYDVKPGNKQFIHMENHGEISKIPYIGYEYIKIDNIDYLTRNSKQDYLIFDTAHGANIVYDSPEACGK